MEPQAVTQTSPGPQPDRQAIDREKVAQLAREFESLLIAQMLREMRRTMLSDDSHEGLGAATMTDTFDGALGSSLSRSGGLGLAQVLLRALDRSADATPPTSGTSPASSATLSAAPEVEPVAPVGPLIAAPAPDLRELGPITSGFGWRPDPIDGRTRFHAGSDLRAAYGQEVRAAGGGRVAFAGEQGGYGLTVVIDHGQGLQTRYAHLSGLDVLAGEAVNQGQVVARSGNSGRSTAPHLHFEVVKNGTPVDPATFIKGVGLDADSHTYRSGHH